MPDIVFSGPEGRIEGRYHPSSETGAPVAIVLHPHPKFRGNMHHPVVYGMFHAFVENNFSVLRFNFRGVGRSEGEFNNGQGELADAASALDWIQHMHPENKRCWVAGFSFGAWIGMQLLMRRPEIDGFVSVSPPVNFFDFSFLVPCPSSGLIVGGGKDIVVPSVHISKLVRRLKTHKSTHIHHATVPGANHFYEKRENELQQLISKYIGSRIRNETPDIDDENASPNDPEAESETQGTITA